MTWLVFKALLELEGGGSAWGVLQQEKSHRACRFTESCLVLLNKHPLNSCFSFQDFGKLIDRFWLVLWWHLWRSGLARGQGSFLFQRFLNVDWSPWSPAVSRLPPKDRSLSQLSLATCSRCPEVSYTSCQSELCCFNKSRLTPRWEPSSAILPFSASNVPLACPCHLLFVELLHLIFLSYFTGHIFTIITSFHIVNILAIESTIMLLRYDLFLPRMSNSSYCVVTYIKKEVICSKLNKKGDSLASQTCE